MTSGQPIEVAIVGGGCAGITAAFELSRREHRGRYHVTLYQVGWRLGGKAASGRGPASRIEEHGIHVWMGFYENAFRLLRECYAELNRDPRKFPIADWRDAFAPEPIVGTMDHSRRGSWLPWLSQFSQTQGTPGDPDTPGQLSVSAYLIRTVELIRDLLISTQDRGRSQTRDHERGAPRRGPQDESDGRIFPVASEIVDQIRRLLTYGVIATTAGLIEAINLVEATLARFPSDSQGLLLQLVKPISESVHAQLRSLTGNDDEMRRVWELIDLALAVVVGIIRFGLIFDPRGLDALDDFDLVEWLQLNGASETIVNSAAIRALYDLPFAYENGDPRAPKLAAGAALRGAFRLLFTYRGSMVWKLATGMGDVVFAPYYQVLKKRGVTFKFFHRLRSVKLSAAVEVNQPSYVESLEFDVQAEIKNGADYQPLVEVNDLPCWPSKPDYRQLVDGENLSQQRPDFESHWEQRLNRKKTLRVTEDFDCIVLAVGLGEIPHVCSELVARNARWREMVTHCKTAATQSFQIWLSEEIEDLACFDTETTITGFVQPFETYADMRQTIAQENWKVRPRSTVYFSGSLPDRQLPLELEDLQFQEKARELVRHNAIRFLNRDVVHILPGAFAHGRFRWRLLVDPETTGGAKSESDESCFDSQFWKANVNPSDRYSLSLPGTLRYRISPLENIYDNLTIAGDWTECGLNTGCVESATISGRLAAHAITGLPRLEEIAGYDHP